MAAGLMVFSPSAMAAGGCQFSQSGTGNCSISPSNPGDLAQVTIHVDSAGLPANTPMVVIECNANPTSSANCEGQTADPNEGNTSATGVFDNQANATAGTGQLFTFHTLPDAQITSTPLRCDSTHPCTIYVGQDFNNWSFPKVLIPVTASVLVPESPSHTVWLVIPSAALLLAGGALVLMRRRNHVSPAA
jgi:hypothetical protein